jgi:UDP-2,3-diacylglucosamine pyrophosphatase LpxH
MITLICSDLHIGDGKSKHLVFYDFLCARPDIDSLIIAGDFFDLWVTSAGRALKEGKYLLDYFRERFSDRVVYLTGNHDEDLQYVKSLNGISIKQFHHFKIGDKSVIVCHGHQYDHNFYLKQATVLAKANAWIVNRVDKVFGVDVRRWLVSISQKIENDPYDKIIKAFETSIDASFNGKFDYVITGHTHLYPYIKKLSNLFLINVGNNIQNSTGLLIGPDSFSLVDYGCRPTEIIKELGVNGGKEINFRV